MNVRELRDALIGLPDDTLVVLQKDPEGNGYSPAAGAGERHLDGRETVYLDSDVGYVRLTPELEMEGYRQGDIIKGGVPCIVLWPEF